MAVVLLWLTMCGLLFGQIKKALGMIDCDQDEKAKSARTAMLFSRTNTLLSFPMLFTMVAAQNLPW